MALAGSIAVDAFDDARALLARSRLADARVRVPFDYSLEPKNEREVSWEPPRALLPADARGPIVDAMRALRRRDTTARELVERSVAAGRAAAALGGVVEECADASRYADVLDAELAAGRDRGPLHGIPITVKDVIDVADVPTRAGSDAYHDMPARDAIAVARLEAAGAIVVAKASTHEFALGVTSPQSRNPHDPSRIPGGSSGGSAVCVVTGAGLGSLGTDTRASIRVPAALSGAVGFKPTYGLVPTDGVVSLSWTMDHLAPLATTVTDAALLLDALLGAKSRLAWTASDGAGRLRIGVVGAGFADAQPGVTMAVERTLDRLTRGGCAIDDSPVPALADLELAGAAGLVISRCEAAAAHRRFELDRSQYWEEVRDQLDVADGIAAVDYLDAQRVRAELRARFASCFDAHDVLAMPTVPVVAPPVDDFARYLMLLARNAIPWSLVGFPAISVPVGGSDGLPVGIQLIAPPGGEARLVEVGRIVEGSVRAADDDFVAAVS
jgi:aspartyl-tRNA(Asn)/glutamyl-tRNA(Gln) amidotransferase subunit A